MFEHQMCVCLCVKGILRAGWFGVIIHSSDSGLAEEAVLVIHQVLIDTGPEIKEGGRVTFNHLKSAESRHSMCYLCYASLEHCKRLKHKPPKKIDSILKAKF